MCGITDSDGLIFVLNFRVLSINEKINKCYCEYDNFQFIDIIANEQTLENIIKDNKFRLM